jgi:endonuclease/exonuclease/phosphatase family metal-dependent hydrolase
VKSKFTTGITIVLSFLTLAVYLMPDLKPVEYPFLGLLVLTIPVFLVINFILMVVWLFRTNKWMALIPCVTIIVGIKYIDRSFSIGAGRNEASDLKILSSNVRIFNVYEHLRDPDYASSNAMINWVRNNKADVACLQEYYNSPDKNFRSRQRINEKFKYSYVVPFLELQQQQFGMAIFSKYPIVNKGEIHFREKSNNQIVFADIKLKNKIVRVYNIHLQSMAINDDQIAETELSSGYGNKLMKGLIRYKNGCIQRSRQVDALVRHIQKCPHPVVVCGDLNEPPYGYVYETLSDQLDNAFQRAGTGFGVTYNGKIPLLRIDNIFTSKSCEVQKFTIHKDIRYSDHYPISAEVTF